MIEESKDMSQIHWHKAKKHSSFKFISPGFSSVKMRQSGTAYCDIRIGADTKILRV